MIDISTHVLLCALFALAGFLAGGIAARRRFDRQVRVLVRDLVERKLEEDTAAMFDAIKKARRAEREVGR